MNKFLIALMLTMPAVGMTACSSTGQIASIEEMSESDWNKWQLYISLGVKIGANRLLQEGVASESDLLLAANVLETIRDQDILPNSVGAWIEPHLVASGLTNDEVRFVVLVMEQEILERGGFEWLNPETELIELSPRTKQLLTVAASSLRSAVLITSDEEAQANQMNADFSRD